MYAKAFTLIALLMMWLGLMGVQSGVSITLLSLIAPIMVYSCALKLDLIPKEIYLNHLSILYFFLLIKEILKSSISVIKLVWSKHLNLDSAFAWINSNQLLEMVDYVNKPYRHTSEIALVICGNSITLTPGTVTVDVSNNTLLIHALKQISIDNLQSNDLFCK